MNQKIEDTDASGRETLYLERMLLPTGEPPTVGSMFSVVEIAVRTTQGELTAARLYHSNVAVKDVWVWDAGIGEDTQSSYYMRFDRMAKALAWLLNDVDMVKAPHVAVEILVARGAIKNSRVQQLETYLSMEKDHFDPPPLSGTTLRYHVAKGIAESQEGGCSALTSLHYGDDGRPTARMDQLSKSSYPGEHFNALLAITVMEAANLYPEDDEKFLAELSYNLAWLRDQLSSAMAAVGMVVRDRETKLRMREQISQA